MNEFLEASDGWVPFLIFLLSAVAVVVVVLIFRTSITRAGNAVLHRIEGGAEVKIGNVLEVGQLVTSTGALTAADSEVRFWGDPDQMQLLFKAQGRGWKKSTKAMQLPNGCLVQVTTERQSADGDWASAEALQFVPDVAIVDSPTGTGRTLRTLQPRTR